MLFIVEKEQIKIKSALVSVYHKTGLDTILKDLQKLNVEIYSTGGTYTFLEELGIEANKIEALTSYPSILGGRVKTLHPKVFGGILSRRDNEQDLLEMQEYEIPAFDLVIVDLYPFEETVSKGASEADIIEKIDIGGISLIRAAAKNFKHVLVIPSQNEYAELQRIITENNGETSLEERKKMSARSFRISSNYDRLIGDYLAGESQDQAGSKQASHVESKTLRYGENPHQKASFHGKLEDVFEQLHGKELSYNNLVDIDAALCLLEEFGEPTCCIIKHTNPCGLSTGKDTVEAWKKALAADSVSAFGGIIGFNKPVDEATANEVDSIFFEVCAAPDFTEEALAILKKKKNRIILKVKEYQQEKMQLKSVLNGLLEQEFDYKSETSDDLKTVTEREPSLNEVEDLLFANRIVKHAKSNAIVLVKDKQLIGIGVGQTSRVDALKQAIAKAESFGFSTEGAVMASDAFFPFPDCVEIGHEAGIKAIIQPGGSIKDQDSIDAANQRGMAMVTTGFRHFKH